MPPTGVRFFRDQREDAPVLEWLRDLRERDRRAYAKCAARIHRLAELGRELRRPEVDFLRDGIYELRARKGRVHYRILYFFHGRDVVILAHALTKEGKVLDADVERAIRRKEALEENPEAHIYEEIYGQEDEERG